MRFPLFVFLFGHPKASLEIQREVFFLYDHSVADATQKEEWPVRPSENPIGYKEIEMKTTCYALFVMLLSCSTGCVSNQVGRRFDNIAYGISLVNSMSSKSDLIRVRNCAFDERIRTAASKRLEEVSEDEINGTDSRLAEIVIGLRETKFEESNVLPAPIDDQPEIFSEMIETDDVGVWCDGVVRITDEKILADIAIAAHKFGEIDGKVCRSVLPAGLLAVEKLTMKAHIERVYENARTSEVRDAAKTKR